MVGKFCTWCMNIFCFSVRSSKVSPKKRYIFNKNTKLPEGFCRKQNYITVIINITTSKQKNNSILDIIVCTKKKQGI